MTTYDKFTLSFYQLLPITTKVLRVGHLVAQSFSASDLKVKTSNPGWRVYVVFLGKTLNSKSASLPPSVYMVTSNLLWGQPDKMLGSKLQWARIPSRGIEILLHTRKPEISAGSHESSGSPNYDWDRLYLTLS